MLTKRSSPAAPIEASGAPTRARRLSFRSAGMSPQGRRRSAHVVKEPESNIMRAALGRSVGVAAAVYWIRHPVGRGGQADCWVCTGISASKPVILSTAKIPLPSLGVCLIEQLYGSVIPPKVTLLWAFAFPPECAPRIGSAGVPSFACKRGGRRPDWPAENW
jgi:hypothetical protein